MGRRIRLFTKCVFALVCAMGLATVLGACSVLEPESTYQPATKDPVVSTPVIGENGVLRVGVNAGNPPLAGTLGGGEIVGLDVDIAAALADQLGVKVRIIDVGTDAENALQAGMVDMVMGLDKSNTNLNCWLSDPYVSSGVCLFARNNTSPTPENVPETTIAAQVSTKSAWTVVNLFDKATLVGAENLENAFDSLSQGKAQYVASDALIGAYVVGEKGLDVGIVSLVQQPSGFSIGMVNANADLQKAVAEALKTLETNGAVKVIQAKWLGTPLDLTKVAVLKSSESASASAEKDAEGEAAETDKAANE